MKRHRPTNNVWLPRAELASVEDIEQAKSRQLAVYEAAAPSLPALRLNREMWVTAQSLHLWMHLVLQNVEKIT